MSERLLDIRGLASGYANVAVISDVNMHVNSGEVVALLGANGAGKSTTLLTISGLLKTLEGSVHVFGEPTTFGAPHKVARKGLAHVAEDRSLFFGLTVQENLRLGLRGTQSEQQSGFNRALDLLPALRPLMNRKAGWLSGGEQQMLALARGLVSNPKLLLVDEMSLGLAPIIVERLLPIVRNIANQAGVGVLIVEQHVHLALEVADRAYVMRRGEIVLGGATVDLREREELLEASYLGGKINAGTT